MGQAGLISTHQCTVPVMLPRHGAESDLSAQHFPREVSATPLDNSSGQVMARSSQLAMPQGEPGSGVEQAAEEQ